jgi:hypothetical protein
LLLCGALSTKGNEVEDEALPLGHRVIQIDPLEFEVIANDVEGGERLQALDEGLHVIILLV